MLMLEVKDLCRALSNDSMNVEKYRVNNETI